MSRSAHAAAAILALFGLLSPAFSAPPPAPLPEQITFQGRLTDASGNPVSSGSLDMTFSIYDVSSGGTARWFETQAVVVSGGLYSVNLGAAKAFPSDLVGGGGEERWLGVAVGSDPEMTPRYALTGAVYARRALAATTADTAMAAITANTATSATTASNALLLGGLSSTSFWQLGGNAVGATGVLGTNGEYALELKVNNTRALRLEPNATSPNIIGGYFDNSVDNGQSGGTIAGGGRADAPNRIWGSLDTIGGGAGNNASYFCSTITGGGWNNASGDYATVAGGAGNMANGRFSFAAGRNAMTCTAAWASHDGAFVWADSTDARFYSERNDQFSARATGGVRFVTALDGSNNPAKTFSIAPTGDVNVQGAVTAAGFSGDGSGLAGLWHLGGNATGVNGVIGTLDNNSLQLIVNGACGLRLIPNDISPNVIGGYAGNTVTSDVMGATIGGGGELSSPNLVTDDFGTVAGGYQNQAGDGAGTTSDARYATVGGGLRNIARGECTTVGGGNDNFASGFGATISGGDYNYASGRGATVGGGNQNTVLGEYGFATGYRAYIPSTCYGSFLFADYSVPHFISIAANEFAVRATGGVRFVTAIDANSGDSQKTFSISGAGDVNVQGTVTATGFNGPLTGTASNSFIRNQTAVLQTAGFNISGDATVSGKVYINTGQQMSSPAILNVAGGTTYYGIAGTTELAEGWGVFGASEASNGEGYGVYGYSNSVVGRGVYGLAAASAGTTYGVYGKCNSPSGYAGYFEGNLNATGKISSAAGMNLDSANANSGSLSPGLTFGAGNTGEGIASQRTSSGSNQFGLDFYTGSACRMSITNGGNVSFRGGMNLDRINANSGSLSPGLRFGEETSGEGIASQRTSSGSNQFGLDFYTGSACRMRITGGGNVQVTGTLSKGGGSFKIDHPLDPENKYLLHSFVESPDMMNIYNGNVVLDGKGEAVVTMPEWFEALNREFRYQLTAIGAPGPDLYVAEEVAGNSFKIAGGKAGLKVSWQVTGVRKDPYAEKHRIRVEEPKPESERGKYLHPEVYGKPREEGIGYLAPPKPMEAAKR